MVDAITNDYEQVIPFVLSDIDDGDSRRLGDVISAQLWPLTGNRSKGFAVVSALSDDVIMQPNTYAVPVVDGQAYEQKRVKVDFNPDTAEAHQTGGQWNVTASGTLVTFKSNVGGSDMNFPAGTELRFIPTLAGVQPTAIVQGPGFTGGTSGIVKQVVQYDDFPNTDAAQACLLGKVGNFPAIVLAWIQSTPIEGRTYGLNQGATRKGRDIRCYYDSYAAYVIVSISQSGEQRRNLALNIKDTVMDLLGDYNRNFDGEYLTFMGTGVEILDVKRITRTENSMLIMMNMRTISVRNRVEFRTFNRWTKSRFRSFQAAIPPSGDSPGNPQDLVTSDLIDPMPQA
jgi:hypothetical protein